MTIARKTILLAVATLLSVGTAFADTSFRGLPKDQGNNLLFSDSLDRLTLSGKPFYIDVRDQFARDGQLDGSDADSLQIGFVPPANGAPLGALTGAMADSHGRWVDSSGDYVSTSADGGRVRRATGNGNAVASTPWRVDPVYGDYYHIEMSAMVAAGETVTIGYLGDPALGQTLDSNLGQLTFELTRGLSSLANQLTWTVAWDNNGLRQSLTNTLTVPEGDVLNMQLGWLEKMPNDTFDAWLGSSLGNTRLVQGNMGTAIDVHAVGFELSGTGSWIGGFTAEVPEPATGTIGLILTLGALAMLRRR